MEESRGSEKDKRLHMLLPEEEWRRLRELAEGRQTSVSELIRSAYQEIYWPRSRLRSMQILQLWNREPALSEEEYSAIADSLNTQGL